MLLRSPLFSACSPGLKQELAAAGVQLFDEVAPRYENDDGTFWDRLNAEEPSWFRFCPPRGDAAAA